MRLFAMWLGLLCAGCATLTRPLGAVPDPETGEYGPPAKETVYLVPIEEAMRMTRRILDEQRYDVLEKEGGLVMFTSAHEPGKNPYGSRILERYYIKGERLGPRQSVVRVFRLSYNEGEKAVEISTAGLADWQRKSFVAANTHPFDTNKVFKTAPDQDGYRLHDLGDPFPDAPSLEGFQLVRGNRDVGIERELLKRLEMVPALELVGGNAAIPASSVMLDGWVETAGEAKALQAECGTPVDGAAPLFASGHTLLLADPLGTRELPSAALRMVCEASSQSMPVALALSLPASEQPLLDTYLDSEGTSGDAQELLSNSSFWRRVSQDGRGSQAMLWLVEQVRRLRASGRDVSLVAFDSDKETGNAREAKMAERLTEYRRRNPGAWLLVLAGAAHVRTTSEGLASGADPFGARLARSQPLVQALDVGFSRGTQFACRYTVWDEVECNVFAISPTLEARQAPDVKPGVRLFPQALKEGFHGRIYVGALSASPPALRASAGAHLSKAAPRPAP
jgi:hypothetical protein